MTITIERARELLPPEYSKMSDEEIQNLIHQITKYCDFILDFIERREKEHPGESRENAKPKEPEPTFNKERHSANKMPMKGDIDQKVKWHIEHIAHCKCRPIPDKIKKEIKKRIGK